MGRVKELLEIQPILDQPEPANIEFRWHVIRDDEDLSISELQYREHYSAEWKTGTINGKAIRYSVVHNWRGL